MAKTLLSTKQFLLLSPPILFPSSTPSPSFTFPPSSKILHYNPYQKRFNLSSKPTNFSRNFSTPSGTECPVPLDQQPINEYQNLSTSFPFSWASGDFVEYSCRLLATGLAFALLVGLPVSWFGSIGSDHDPINLFLGSVSSGLFVVTLSVLRMYLGWAYVGNRLLSATVECNLLFSCSFFCFMNFFLVVWWFCHWFQMKKLDGMMVR